MDGPYRFHLGAWVLVSAATPHTHTTRVSNSWRGSASLKLIDISPGIRCTIGWVSAYGLAPLVTIPTTVHRVR